MRTVKDNTADALRAYYGLDAFNSHPSVMKELKRYVRKRIFRGFDRLGARERLKEIMTLMASPQGRVYVRQYSTDEQGRNHDTCHSISLNPIAYERLIDRALNSGKGLPSFEFIDEKQASYYRPSQRSEGDYPNRSFSIWV